MTMNDPATLERTLSSEADTLSLGVELAALLKEGGVVYLQGDLGAGKTTLSRGIVQALGHSGAVKSPTYTLVEPYELSECQLYHFDLYRLADPEELEFVGIRDFLESGRQKPTVFLIEWPDRGGDFIPASDLTVRLQVQGAARLLKMQADSEIGLQWLEKLTKKPL